MDSLSSVEKTKRYGLVLLAAGGSSRLGRPKQLLEYEGQSLLRRAAEAALGSRCEPVIVVLGCEAEACAKVLAGLPVRIIVNEKWSEGLAGSIRVGIQALEEEQAGLFCGMIAVADQPQLSAAMLDALIDKQIRSGAKMVAAEYAGKAGVPALFCASLFGQLKALDGDQGARQILRTHPLAVVRVPFPGGAEDIDTPEDWAKLRDPAR